MALTKYDFIIFLKFHIGRNFFFLFFLEKQLITEQRTAGPVKPVAAAVPLMSG